MHFWQPGIWQFMYVYLSIIIIYLFIYLYHLSIYILTLYLPSVISLLFCCFLHKNSNSLLYSVSSFWISLLNLCPQTPLKLCMYVSPLTSLLWRTIVLSLSSSNMLSQKHWNSNLPFFKHWILLTSVILLSPGFLPALLMCPSEFNFLDSTPFLNFQMMVCLKRDELSLGSALELCTFYTTSPGDLILNVGMNLSIYLLYIYFQPYMLPWISESCIHILLTNLLIYSSIPFIILSAKFFSNV